MLNQIGLDDGLDVGNEKYMRNILYTIHYILYSIYTICIRWYTLYTYVCIYTHTHIYIIMEYYSVIKKEGILLFSTTWMDLESIILNERNQRKTNTICH